MGMSRGLCVLPGRWVGNLEEEFFRQGDEEKRLRLPVSPLLDRDKAGVTKSQVGGISGRHSPDQPGLGKSRVHSRVDSGATLVGTHWW